MAYRFHGHDAPSIAPIGKDFSKIRDQYHLYDLLSGLWCAATCAPRMRSRWSEGNKTLGQCSITAFLVQDIFGGEVYGIPLEEGGYHCFNRIGDVEFDLTSEQFGDRHLDYATAVKQDRTSHFAKEEKYRRYLSLKETLQASIR